jgi:hypothetical protein
MPRLPSAVKLLPAFIGGWTVLLNGVEIGTVRSMSHHYRIHGAFVMRWWQAQLINAPHPLGFDPALRAQGRSLRDLVTHFPTRQAALDALLEALPKATPAQP